MAIAVRSDTATHDALEDATEPAGVLFSYS